MKRLWIGLLFVFCYVGVVSAESPTNTITVADGSVAIANDDRCSIFEAIENANGGSIHSDCAGGNPTGSDVITLASLGSYTFDTRAPSITSEILIQGFGSTLNHTGAGFFDVAASGSLTLRQMTLEGSDGSFGAIEAEGTLHIESSTLRENITSSSGAAVDIRPIGAQNYSFTDVAFVNNVAAGFGGAIYVSRASDSAVTVVIDSAEFTNNGKWVFAGSTETLNGGALYLSANLLHTPLVATIADSTFSGNYGGSGGAINVNDNIDLTIRTTTVDANEAQSQGAGLRNRFGTIRIDRSTFSNNVTDSPTGSSSGGAIHNFKGSVTVTNSTISGNEADRGGGIYSRATDAINNDSANIILNHVTLTDNTANQDSFGGGIYNEQSGDIEARVNVQNSILLGNTTPLSNFDCRNNGGTMQSFGYNVKSGSALAGCSFTGGTGDVSVPGAAADHVFPTLADNGGTTLTHRIPQGSDARNLIPNGTNGCNSEAVDQRNVLRQSGNAGTMCDAGAYEWGGDSLPTAILLREHQVFSIRYSEVAAFVLLGILTMVAVAKMRLWRK